MLAPAKRTLLVVAAALLTEAVRLRPEPAPAPPLVTIPLRRGARAPQEFRGEECAEELESVLETPAVDYITPEMEELQKEQTEIYRLHWEPLEPPPYHHPLYYPTLRQFKELEKLEQDYTLYWRSLPQYPQVSPWMEKAQQSPYLKMRNWTDFGSREGIIIDDFPVQLMFVFHHKTGVTIRANIQDVLPVEKIGNISESHEPYLEIPQDWPRDMKVVHFMRDPVDTIISGYRYHMNRWGSETWSWGHLSLQDPPCYNCDDEDHTAIFDTCGLNCTYFELLNRLNESDGIAVEAVSARQTLTAMANFLAFRAFHPNTLHLSMDLFDRDVDRTSRCLLYFLGLTGDGDLEKAVAKAAGHIDDKYHVTSGRYNNTQIRAYLESHPVWSADFQAIRNLMGEVYRHQAKIWGCPEG